MVGDFNISGILWFFMIIVVIAWFGIPSSTPIKTNRFINSDNNKTYLCPKGFAYKEKDNTCVKILNAKELKRL